LQRSRSSPNSWHGSPRRRLQNSQAPRSEN